MSVELQKATSNRDRNVALAAIVILGVLSWAYMLHLGSGMGSMGRSLPASPAESAMMARPMAWGLTDFGVMFVMWAVMMVAMMLPSATPMILLYTKVAQKRESEARARSPVWLFMAGYLLVWTGFSALATVLGWGLHTGGLLTSMMGRVSPVMGAVVLIAAGAFQWTSWKYTCLSHCRSPIAFLTTHWRDGTLGALRMGLHHGAYCTGCCWLLMALLFVLGVMNLIWVATLAVFIFLEKLTRGRLVSRVSGAAMMAWGIWLLTMT